MSNYSKRQKGYLVKLDERLPRTKYCTDFLREEYESIKSDSDKREVLCDIISSEIKENPKEISGKDRILLETILNMSEIADNLLYIADLSNEDASMRNLFEYTERPQLFDNELRTIAIRRRMVDLILRNIKLRESLDNTKD
jgi:hypothetical protein